MMTNNTIKFLRTLHQKAGRTKAGLFIAEGEKIIADLSNFFELDTKYIVGEGCTAEQMARVSQLKTPTGQLATFRIPTYSTMPRKGRVVVLDSVQDPGNLGTIIRTCEWFGVRAIVCSVDTADAYNPKVVQATMGALGRVPLYYINIQEWLEWYNNPIFGTFLEESVDYREVDYPENCAIVMGNEGHGISAGVEAMVSNRIHIPRSVGSCSESLNVATATAVVLSRL